MKYVLVDNDDNVVDRVDLESEVGISGARTFFIGRKQIPYENFIQLWKVMTEESFQLQLKLSLKNRQIEWWNDDNYLDIDR